MYILAIDSTSFTPRIWLVHDTICVKEEAVTNTTEKWIKMKEGDVSGLVEDFLTLLNTFFDDTNIKIQDIDLICYSWYSGFQSVMNLWKILARTLGKLHSVEVLAVDHVTAHYFSRFTHFKWTDLNEGDFPILFFSASGSHNSLSLLKNRKELTVLNDYTYFDVIEKKHIGLWNIYYKFSKICGILEEGESDKNITKKILECEMQENSELVKHIKSTYEEEGIFDTNFYFMFHKIEKNITFYMKKYDKKIIFASFEVAIFEILLKKFHDIMKIIPFRQICIVWWISNNDTFFKKVEEEFWSKMIDVNRPEKNFRFDNASMLWTLAFYIKDNKSDYPVSKIIT